MTNTALSLLFACMLAVPAGAVQTSPQPAPAPADVPADYVIGPEDVLGIVFWREAELSGDVTVRPDGRITLPVIGELVAAGVRPDELQKQIVELASKYINDPNVAVVVRTINSRKFFVTGRVADPGTFDLRSTMTVMQAIAMAGGLTEYANGKNITILRKGTGRTEVLKFNYRDVARGRNLEQDVVLRPGDTVVVP
jgi:polysaccharide biosynthesis/export protein